MQERQTMLAWMSVCMVLSYLPWYSFSAVVNDISREFALTAGDVGAIIAAFQAGYVIVVPLTGWLADRAGAKQVVLGATVLTAVFSTGAALFTYDKSSILLLRLLTGCAAGAIYAPGMALLANWFPPRERGNALGSYTAALTVASAGGYFIAGPLSAAYGWRFGMLCTGLPAFLAAMIIWRWVKEKPLPALAYDGARPAPGGGWGGPAVITAAYMGHMWELYAFWGWLGPFLVACAAAAGFSSSEAIRWGGLWAAWITLAGAPAVWLLGRVADRLGRIRTILLCATASLLAEFGFGYLLGRPLWMVIGWGLWIGFWSIADSAIFKAGLTEMVAQEKRGMALGLQSASGFLATVFAPVAFGKVLESGGGAGLASANWGPAFAVLGIGALITPVLTYALRRRPQSGLMANGGR
ncbi:MAG TPA: MFS transporter [Selenomonadales bacterium]|nr:MFS transporter [Selenomonadales bacterium]